MVLWGSSRMGGRGREETREEEPGRAARVTVGEREGESVPFQFLAFLCQPLRPFQTRT